jgi:Xaa-Pro dipeptidase
MRDAAQTSVEGVKAGIAAVRVGATDNDVAAAVHQAMIAAGSEYVALGPFVATGLRTTIMHGIWSRNTIGAGESVMLEVGGCVNRYHAAMFRTVSVGPPSAKLRYMFEVSDAANQATMGAIKPGVTCGAVYDACQKVFMDSKLPDECKKQRAGMRNGYSMGIAFAPGWGEWETLAFGKDDPTPLEAGMTFHIPAAIREYGVYGAALSETLLVTPKGCEPLTKYPRELFVR